ncbi:MAG: hypothetical protein D6681_05385 [Calditrichaeota bacterium]|nr:MAG: hypothetical protein D6681_05385 [Calditrichota bacterium]
MRILVIIGCVLLITQIMPQTSLEEVSKTKAISDEIMQYFVKEEFVQGFDIAKKYWPLPPVEIEGLINQINTQWAIVRQRFGKSIGMEFIREERIGKSFVRYYYLHKFEKHALCWSFTYYKPGDEWVMNSVNFQDKFEFLFESVK